MLIAILGDPGHGKSLVQTAFLFRAWSMGSPIFSNYWLAFPHTRIRKIEDFEGIRYGTFGGDELWDWLDARASGSEKNQLVNSILLKARKRGFDVYYTAQHFLQMDPRIRRTTSVIMVPQLDRLKDPTFCRIKFYNKHGERIMKPLTIYCPPVFDLYDTTEEVEELGGFEAAKARKALKDYRAIRKAKELGLRF